MIFLLKTSLFLWRKNAAYFERNQSTIVLNKVEDFGPADTFILLKALEKEKKSQEGTRSFWNRNYYNN
jgi:hypothetical protein